MLLAKTLPIGSALLPILVPGRETWSSSVHHDLSYPLLLQTAPGFPATLGIGDIAARTEQAWGFRRQWPECQGDLAKLARARGLHFECDRCPIGRDHELPLLNLRRRTIFVHLRNFRLNGLGSSLLLLAGELRFSDPF